MRQEQENKVIPKALSERLSLRHELHESDQNYFRSVLMKYDTFDSVVYAALARPFQNDSSFIPPL